MPRSLLPFAFLLLTCCAHAQYTPFLQLLDTVPQLLDRDLEVNDMVVTKDAIYLAGTEKVKDSLTSRFFPYTLYPCLVKLTLNNRLAWKKIIKTPFNDCGLSAIAESNGRLFVAGMSRHEGFVMEITGDGDTLWSTGMDRPELTKDSLTRRSQHNVHGEKIVCLLALPDGRVIAGGQAGCDFDQSKTGLAQCVYPKEKRTPCIFYPATFSQGWSQVDGIAATKSGFVLATSIGVKRQENFTLVYTDDQLKETRRTVFAKDKRSEAHAVLVAGEKIYAGGESDGNFFAATGLSGDSLCSFGWAHDRQNDVYGLAAAADGKVLALHQLGDNSGVTLFSGCDSLSGVAFSNRVDVDEHPVAVYTLPGGGYVVVTRADDYTSSIEKSVEYCIIRFLSPQLKIKSTQILLHITP